AILVAAGWLEHLGRHDVHEAKIRRISTRVSSACERNCPCHDTCMCDRHRLVRALLAALLLARTAAVDCSTPLAFEPIPDLHVHVGFPVDYTARLNRYCFTFGFEKVPGRPSSTTSTATGFPRWSPRATIACTPGMR